MRGYVEWQESQEYLGQDTSADAFAESMRERADVIRAEIVPVDAKVVTFTVMFMDQEVVSFNSFTDALDWIDENEPPGSPNYSIRVR